MPVGVDQVQHLEFTIRIAEKLNQRRNEIFNVPNAVVFESKIKSLSNPSAKMSKSDNSPHGCLYITDTPEVIETKVTRAVTDCHPGISYDPKLRPGVSSLVQLYSHCTNKAIGDIEAMYSNHKSCSDLKRDLARVIANRFESARESFELLVRRPYEVEEILKAGAAAARVVASETYSLIRSTLLL